MNYTSLTVNLANETIQLLVDSVLPSRRFKWNTYRHCNAEFEVHIILSGSCTLDVGDQAYPFSTGNAIMIVPGRYHSAHNVSEGFERLSLSLVVTPGGYVEELLYRLSKLPVFGLTEKQLELCRQFIQEVNASDVFHLELAQAYATALLASIFRIVSPEFSAKGSLPEETEVQPRVVVDRFFCSWPTPVGSEEELAQLLNVSRRQVIRFLQQNYGMSFREKYLRSRMDYAAWLLRTTNWNTREIAQKVNYSSESVFLSSFKKYFGTTPTEYRRTYSPKSETD